jgi:putative intracellular protease/amidase
MFTSFKSVLSLAALAAVCAGTALASAAGPDADTLPGVPPATVCAHLADHRFVAHGTAYTVFRIARADGYAVANVRAGSEHASVAMHLTAHACTAAYLATAFDYDSSDLVAAGVPPSTARRLLAAAIAQLDIGR